MFSIPDFFERLLPSTWFWTRSISATCFYLSIWWCSALGRKSPRALASALKTDSRL